MYGTGKHADHPKDAKAFMQAAFSNMDDAKKRFNAAHKILMEHKMARKRIEMVYLNRQPHRDGLRRLQLTYQLLIESAKQASTEEQPNEKPSSQLQEVEKCQ